MSDDRKSCERDFYRLGEIVTDRLFISGRRGTGKSTGIKAAVAGLNDLYPDGLRVIWLARTKELAASMPDRFVPPAVAGVLPVPSEISTETFPQFCFGRGAVRVLPIRSIPSVRDTGVDVGGAQADAIICDEAIRPDGVYIRNEPLLIDDLAETIGRNGTLPRIIVAGNPITNTCPYAYQWRVNLLAEGIYSHKGRTTQVVGTKDCRDCFGKRIGIDADAVEYAEHLDSSGDVVTVNGTGLRLLFVRGWLYAGLAEPSQHILMRNGRMTQYALMPKASRLLRDVMTCVDRDAVVFDSFEAQMRLYELLRLK